MTHDVETLTRILRWVLDVAAVCATSFPVLYMFYPWWTTALGRILMLHGVALAIAIDVTVLFQFWDSADILVYFWIEIVVFSLIATASLLMTIWLWRINFYERKLRGRTRSSDQQSDVQRS